MRTRLSNNHKVLLLALLYILHFSARGHDAPIWVDEDLVTLTTDLTYKTPIDKIISGKVLGEDGGSLPGANVIVKGTTIGTTTDVNGNFKLSVPDDAVLLISYIGYATQEVAINNETVINVTLELDALSLAEVVVTGYGEQRKSDFTGAVSSVKGSELALLPMQRVDQALQGRAAGVMVVNTDGSPGGNTTIRIRGSNSVNGSNSALIVIDGLQGGDLRSLNPNDIESIEVLKDASATAVYGSQGANGVVLITTKKGRKGTPAFNYNFSTGTQKLRNKIDVMDAVQYANTINEFRLSEDANGPRVPIYTADQIAGFEANGGTDWQDEIYNKGTMQNHQLSIGGASDKVSYFVSGGSLDQKGILINSAYKRYSLRANLNIDINKWSNFGLSLATTKEIGNSPPFGEGTAVVDPVAQAPSMALRWAPVVSVYNALGAYNLTQPGLSSSAWNPVASALEPDIQNNTALNQINIFLEFKPLKGLSLRISGGAITQNTNNFHYFSRLTQPGAGSSPTGSARMLSGTFARYQNTNQLTYDTRLGNHHITLTAVAEQQIQDAKDYSFRGTGYAVDATGVNNFGAAAVITGGSTVIKRVLNSYLGRVNYVFLDKYALTASYRADGSSVFGANNKWGYFPSVGAAWSASEEGFIKDLNIFTTLKLRASWGVTGSQAISPYQTLPQLSSTTAFGGTVNYPYNGNATTQTGFAYSIAGNPDLKWESTTQSNVGLDVGIFNGRLTATAEYYEKTTRDLLLALTLPAFTGFGGITSNVGSVGNKGIELSIAGDPLVGELKWNTGFVLSANKSKVLNLGALTTIEFRTSASGGINFSNAGRTLMNLTVGHPIGEMTGYGVLGTWSESEKDAARLFGQLPGDQKFEDINEDGRIDALDLKVIGQALPKFIFGWTNQVSYKNFDLNFLFQGTKGNDLFNGNRIRSNGPGEGVLAELLDRWTPTHQDTSVPAFIKQSERTAANLPPSTVTARLLNRSDNRISRYVEDASYIRLRNITLSYNLPKSLMGSRISRLRVYTSAANLITLTKYTGYDPETSSYNNNDARMGIDYSNYPTAKTYTIGLDLTF